MELETNTGLGDAIMRPQIKSLDDPLNGLMCILKSKRNRMGPHYSEAKGSNSSQPS